MIARKCSNKSLERNLAKFVQRISEMEISGMEISGMEISEMDQAPGLYWIESASGLLLHRRGTHEARSISRVSTFLRSILGATYAGPGELPM